MSEDDPACLSSHKVDWAPQSSLGLLSEREAILTLTLRQNSLAGM